MSETLTPMVARGWIEQWVAAIETGDTDSTAEAVDAMNSSRSWAVFDEMEPEGSFPEVVWGFADAMAGDGTITGGTELTVEESYVQALGCPGE